MQNAHRRCSFHFLCLLRLHNPGNDAEPLSVPIVHHDMKIISWNVSDITLSEAPPLVFKTWCLLTLAEVRQAFFFAGWIGHGAGSRKFGWDPGEGRHRVFNEYIENEMVFKSAAVCLSWSLPTIWKHRKLSRWSDSRACGFVFTYSAPANNVDSGVLKRRRQSRNKYLTFQRESLFH